MPNPKLLDRDPETGSALPASANEQTESFGDILSQFEQAHAHPSHAGPLEGSVIAVSGDSVFVDIAFKIEGILPLADFQAAGEAIKAGDRLPVSIKGRHPEGYYEL